MNMYDEIELLKLKVDEQLIEDVRNTGNVYGKPRFEHQTKIFNTFLDRIAYIIVSDSFTEILDTIMEYVYFTYIHEDKPYTPSVIDGKKHSKGRSPAEREKRRSDDFKKNVLPELGYHEKRHFAKKFKKP